MPFFRLLKIIEEKNIDLPIQVDDVVEALVEMGMADVIAVDQMDEAALDGLFVKEIVRDGVYVEPKVVCAIFYSTNIPIEEQRLVCFKELVHVMDAEWTETNSVDDINSLVENLTTNDARQTLSADDYHALVDRLAVYKALPILLPLPKRNEFKRQLVADEITIKEIAEIAKIPVYTAELMMDDEWPEIQSVMEGHMPKGG